MKITRENIAELTEKIHVSLQSEDFLPKYDEALKNYRRKVDIKGFRPGTVPLGMVKKLYGSSILTDTVRNLVNERMTKFFEEEKIEYLMFPIPDETIENDWENPSELNFIFEIGLKPVIDFEQFKNVSFQVYETDVEDEPQKICEIFKENNARLEPSEMINEKSMLSVNVQEVDAEKNPVSEGLNFEKISLKITEITDDEFKNSLFASKLNDKLVVNATKVFNQNSDIITKIKEETKTKDIKPEYFELTINEIKEFVPKELDKDFFNRIFEEGKVNNIEEFIQVIKEKVEAYYNQNLKYLSINKIFDEIIQQLNIVFPDKYFNSLFDLTVKEEHRERLRNPYITAIKRKYLINLYTEAIIKSDLSHEAVLDVYITNIIYQYLHYGIIFKDEIYKNLASGYLSKNKDQLNQYLQIMLNVMIFDKITSESSIIYEKRKYSEIIELLQNIEDPHINDAEEIAANHLYEYHYQQQRLQEEHEHDHHHDDHDHKHHHDHYHDHNQRYHTSNQQHQPQKRTQQKREQ